MSHPLILTSLILALLVIISALAWNRKKNFQASQRQGIALERYRSQSSDPFPGKIHPKCEGGPAGLAYIDGNFVPCPKCYGSQICEGVYCHPDDRRKTR